MASDPGILSQIFSRMVNTVNSKISSISKFTMKVQNLSNNIVQKVQEKFSEFLKTMTSNPKSKHDYWRIAGIYFAKKFVITFMFVVGALIYIFVSLVVPNLEGRLWYARFAINSKKAQQFSGKAKIYDTDNKLIYKGELSSGVPNGMGEQWDIDGNLKHKGYFKMGQYEGTGEQFDPLGKMVYSGNFSGNVYEGTGQLINSFGKVTYVGEFKNGMKSGKGTEYDPKTGARKYYGEFANDKYEGKGIKYESNGEAVSFEGNFKDGLYDGAGKKYKDNYLIYEGNFKSGKYSGSGIEYDQVSKNIIYKGDFEDGKYKGTGELYDSNNFKLKYKGDFENGEMHGEGILYDKIGVPVFSGRFRNDAIDYISYFGNKLDKIYEIFGKPSSLSVFGDKKIAHYPSLDSVMVFSKNADGNYVFEKVLIRVDDKFMGLKTNSSVAERKSKFGNIFSCSDYEPKEFQKLAFSILSIQKINNLYYTEKYIFNNYYIRLFFKDHQSAFFIFEIGN